MISPLCASVFSSVKQFIIVATARAIRHLTQVDMKKAIQSLLVHSWWSINVNLLLVRMCVSAHSV